MAQCQQCGAEVGPGRILCDRCADKLAAPGEPLREPSPKVSSQTPVAFALPGERRGRRLTAILGITAVVVIGGMAALALTGVLNLGAFGGAASDGSLSFVPQEAAICVTVDLEALVKDAKPLREIPELVWEGIRKASGKDPLKEFEQEAGVDFKKDAVPALPKQLTFAVCQPGEGEKGPRIIVAGRPRDLEKAKGLADKLRKKAEEKGRKGSEEKYRGCTIVSLPSGQTGTAYAISDGHFVLGTSVESVKAALDAHQSPEKRLEKTQGFQGLQSQLKVEPDIMAYVDTAAWVQIIQNQEGLPFSAAGMSPSEMQPPGAALGPGRPGFPLAPPKLSAEEMEILKGTASVVGVDFTGKGVEVENIDQPGEGLKKLMAGMAELPPADRGLLGRMPAAPMALAAMTSPAQTWNSAKEMLTLPQMAFVVNLLRMGLSGAGLDLEKDILGWMKGTAAAGLYYDTKPFPNLVFAWDMVNPEEVKSALTRIRDVVGRATKGKVGFAEEQREGATVISIQAAELAMVPFLKPVLALTEKTLYFCSLESGLKNVLATGKGSAADSVAELPKEAHFLGIMDFPAFSKFLADLAPVLTALSGGQKAAAAEQGLKKVADVLNCFGKATGFSQIRSDSSSLERYSLPVTYDALVKVLKGFVEEIKTPTSKATPTPQPEAMITPPVTPGESTPAAAEGGLAAVVTDQSLAAAFAAARQDKKPVMAIFSAPSWCSWCVKLDRETLTDANVQQQLKRFHVVFVDFDEEKELVSKYQVTGVPHTILFDNSGRKVHEIGGFRPPEEFIEEVKTGLSKAS